MSMGTAACLVDVLTSVTQRQAKPVKPVGIEFGRYVTFTFEFFKTPTLDVEPFVSHRIDDVTLFPWHLNTFTVPRMLRPNNVLHERRRD